MCNKVLLCVLWDYEPLLSLQTTADETQSRNREQTTVTNQQKGCGLAIPHTFDYSAKSDRVCFESVNASTI